MKSIPIPRLNLNTLFIPQEDSKFMIMDSMLGSESSHIHIVNDSQYPVFLGQGTTLGSLQPAETLDKEPPININPQVKRFMHLVDLILKKPKDDQPEPEGQVYQDQQPDLPTDPKPQRYQIFLLLS